jgi:hypothetical protein
MLIWLLMGPVPLFLVLAWQAHRPQIEGRNAEGSRPSVLMIAAPEKPAVPDQIKKDPAAKNPEIAKELPHDPGRKAGR